VALASACVLIERERRLMELGATAVRDAAEVLEHVEQPHAFAAHHVQGLVVEQGRALSDHAVAAFEQGLIHARASLLGLSPCR